MIHHTLDCGSLLSLSSASLMARGRSKLRAQSGSKLPQSKVGDHFNFSMTCSISPTRGLLP